MGVFVSRSAFFSFFGTTELLPPEAPGHTGVLEMPTFVWKGQVSLGQDRLWPPLAGPCPQTFRTMGHVGVQNGKPGARVCLWRPVSMHAARGHLSGVRFLSHHILRGVSNDSQKLIRTAHHLKS